MYKGNEKAKRKTIYNYSSTEDLKKPTIIGGDPSGIISYNSTPHKFAQKIYRAMQDGTWFASQINISKDKTNYPKLPPEIKAAYDLVLAQLITNDSIQTNQLVDSINQYITSPVVNAALTLQAYQESQHCYIDGTQILTNRGFVDFKDLQFTDKVANYTENGLIFFNHPKDIQHYSYNGLMYRFYETNYEQIVTPNHRVVTRFPMYSKRVPKGKEGKIRIENAESISVHNYNLPISGFNIGMNQVMSIEDRIAVAFQADGYKPYGDRFGIHCKAYQYRFSFKRTDKINRMRMLLVMSKLRFTETTTHSGYTHFYVWSERLYDKNFDWVTLEDKHPLWCLQFIEELKYWDGSIRNNDSILYTNTNKIAIDKVMAMATISGYQCGCYNMKATENRKDCKSLRVDAWQLYLIPGKDHKTGREMQKTSFDYSGMVHCCTSDTGMIICRYNDTIFVSGNSESYSIMAEDICEDTDRIYELWRYDDELFLKNKAVADMYNVLYQGDSPTNEDLLLAFAANQILEEMVFPGGFVFFHSIEDYMPSSDEIIQEIQKDELLHVKLFQGIFRTAVTESFDGVVPKNVVEKIHTMVANMCNAEIRWTKYISKNLLGYSEDSIRIYIESQANSVCKNLGLPLLYEEVDITKNPLRQLLLSHYKNKNDNTTKTLFFEANVADYQKSGPDMNTDLGSVNWDD